jgi:hypothetical protein
MMELFNPQERPAPAGGALRHPFLSGWVHRGERMPACLLTG